MNENLISEKKKWVASLLALFLGMMGIHRFYLGRNASGAVMSVVFVLGVLIPIVGCA
ncbi:TM2 domain-containing protein [Holdemanella biformis]|mgnify:FL=1|uniref:TM2 domain-containing protein n=1 Tax=Holdemanella biformis TaxID=1735 RepID=UPI00307EFC92